MLRDTAVSRILIRCGNRQADTAFRQHTIDEMVQAIKDLERSPELPWFLMLPPATYAGFATALGVATVTMPSTFLRESDALADSGSIRYYDSVEATWNLVTKKDLAVIESEYTNEAQGAPLLYTLIGESFYFGPTPDAVYTLKLTGYFADASLAGAYGDAANIENKWLKYAPDLIVGITGAVIAGEYLKDSETAQTFAANAQRAAARLQVESIHRVEAGMMRQVGA